MKLHINYTAIHYGALLVPYRHAITFYFWRILSYLWRDFLLPGATFFTAESRFFEYSIIRNSRFFEPKVVSLGFASVKHCNFTPDFSNARIFETPDISNNFFLPFRNLHSISRTLKTQEPTKTGFSHIHT